MNDETQQLIEEYRAIRDRLNRTNATEVLTQVRTLLDFACHRFTPPPDFHEKARATEQWLSYGLVWANMKIWLTAQPHSSKGLEYAIAIAASAVIEGKTSTVDKLYPIPKGLSEPQIQPFVVATVLELLGCLTSIAPAALDDSTRVLRSRLEGVPLALDHLIQSIQDYLRDRALFADFFDFDHEPTVKQLNRPVRHNIDRLRVVVDRCHTSLDWIQEGGLPYFWLECIPSSPHRDRHELFIDLSLVSAVGAIAIAKELGFTDAVLVRQAPLKNSTLYQLHLMLWQGWRGQATPELDQTVDELCERLNFDSNSIHHRRGWWSSHPWWNPNHPEQPTRGLI